MITMGQFLLDIPPHRGISANQLQAQLFRKLPVDTKRAKMVVGLIDNFAGMGIECFDPIPDPPCFTNATFPRHEPNAPGEQ